MTKIIELLKRTMSLWIIERKIRKRKKLDSKLKKLEAKLFKLIEEYNKKYLY